MVLEPPDWRTLPVPAAPMYSLVAERAPVPERKREPMAPEVLPRVRMLAAAEPEEIWGAPLLSMLAKEDELGRPAVQLVGVNQLLMVDCQAVVWAGAGLEI